MKTIFILYMPGHAGNFLARLFSLGEETVPQLPNDYLKYIVSNGIPDQQLNRLELYSFNRVLEQHADWQDFHRAWGDFHQNVGYNLVNVFLKNKQAIVYAIHPHEFNMFIPVIKQIESTEYYAVELNDRYQSWVDHSRSRLNFVWREDEHNQYDQLKQQYNMSSINLSKMLDNELEFQQEYQRVCACMGLQPQIESAGELYRSWRAVRV